MQLVEKMKQRTKARWREFDGQYLKDVAPRLGGMRKSGLVNPLLLVPPELCCMLEALDDRELMSPRSPEVMELPPVRHGEISPSNTWQSTTGSSLSW